MKKLITLFVLFLGLGLANAQETKPTKDETVKYINDLYKKAFDSDKDVKIESVTLDGKILLITFASGRSFRRPIFKKESLKIVKRDNDNLFSIYYESDISELIWAIQTEEDAKRLKKALEHLIDILQNEKNADPFGD